MDLDEIEYVAANVVDACVEVHRELGPGLLESVDQICLSHELTNRGLHVSLEVPMPVRYGSVEIETGYRVDMIVNDTVLVENKSVKAVMPIHEAQLLTYLRLSRTKVGFLVNWNVPLIRQGIKRMVHKR